MRLGKEFKFEASHILTHHTGKCRNLHGHSWVLKVYVDGTVNPKTGFVMDYGEIKAAVQPLIDQLDHHHLGAWDEIETPNTDLYKRSYVLSLPRDFYPTSENLLLWIGLQLHRVLNWSELQLNETCTSSATLTRAEFEGRQS